MGLDTVELVLESEKYFGVSVPDKRAEKIETVEQFARLLCELRGQTPSPLPYDVVLLQLQQIVASRFMLPIEHVVPEAQFVKDLGLD